MKIPKLEKKVLVIKDFATIEPLSKNTKIKKKIRDMIQDQKRNKKKNINTFVVKKSIPINKWIKVRTEHDVFIWTLKSALQKGENELNRIIQVWWQVAFEERPFPQEGGLVNDLQLAIRYKLMHTGMIKNGMEVTETFQKNYNAAINFEFKDFTETSVLLRNCDKLNEYANYKIYSNNSFLTEENDMPKKKGTKIKKIEKNTEKKVVKRTVVKEEKNTTRKLGATGLACLYLMERKHTDEEIFNLVTKEHSSFQKKFISIQRSDINAGRKPKHQVTKPIPQYVRDDQGKLISKASKIAKKETKKETKKVTKKETKKKKKK